MTADTGPLASPIRKRLGWVVLALVAAAALIAWNRLKPQGMPPGIASGNGRIEATDIDVATRTAGRLKDVLVKEGDDVEAGQVLAHMDTATLEADLQRAQSQVNQARNAKATAAAMLAQREQAVTTASAVVSQRQAELNLASKQLQRTQELVNKGFLSPQKLDEVQAQVMSAKAGVSAAQSQVAEAKTAITATRSQLQESDAAIATAQASLARVQADLDESVLKAPRPGRVQVLAAQAGEVLGAGGRVVSLVDVGDVYMTFFLPETAAGRVAIGSEARLVLDAAPQYVIPAKVTFVASVAQFTPKTVETTAERQKLVFKVRAQIDRALLDRYRQQVKTGMPGMAYVRVQPDTPWPDKLNVALPEQPYPKPDAQTAAQPVASSASTPSTP
ncbi:MAG TPA: HlyD family efflux transporter periplasmic adaptor subunit [Aquabacterium sp.]|uniref:HlyD family secretion protein n=1 Tax=Aquabacterium sp. TaxID=1872578 RepID=UPI002E37A73D|nr:HlyD family efflux transporter periplasmic adaptor subunit [Aquabacterium sp.]HEX5357675.1 HlyD family efflux transporter periplasmic adaptor subunit [Aquabacterium sp.]